MVFALDSFLGDAAPIYPDSGLRALAYKALMGEIAELRIYDHPGELQLDECKLSRDLGVSRTPIREALTILEHQGFVRRRPRHGVFVVKKTRREIIEMVYACAALESMAVRLACAKATEAQLGALRASFSAFYEVDPPSGYHRYFEARWRFCRHAATLAQCGEILSMLDHLLLHLRSIHETIFRQSINLGYLRAAYGAIIEALELRDAERASQLVLERGFRFARDIESCGHCFEPPKTVI
ncbi:GntR family transcriptional regulator [Methylobacterium sp. CM6257]|jgi:DNA-binding GntR family transcriptional regulator